MKIEEHHCAKTETKLRVSNIFHSKIAVIKSFLIQPLLARGPRYHATLAPLHVGDMWKLSLLPVLLSAAQYTRELALPSYKLKAVAVSFDASKMIGTASDKIYITTDWDFASNVEQDLSGTLVSVAISHDGTKAIIGAEYGNVYVSSDSGSSWTATSLSSSLRWYGVAMSSDGSKMVACSNPSFQNGDYNGQLQMSTDGGSTWNALSPSGRFRDVAMSTDGQVIAATAEEGKVHISTDGGSTFTERGDTLKWSKIAMSSDGSKMIASLIYTGTVGYVSLDGGVTWTQPTLSSGEWDDVAITSDGSKMYVIGTGSSGKIWVSTDDGSTWQEDFDSGKDWKTITVSPDGNVVVALENSVYHKDWPTTTTTGTTVTDTTVTVTMTNTSTSATATTSVTQTTSVTTTEVTETATIVTETTFPEDGGAGTTGAVSTTSTPSLSKSTTSGSDATSTSAAATVVEVTLTLTVDDPSTMTGDTTLQNAMIQGFATVMNVDPSQVTLSFQVSRRLHTRKLQVGYLLRHFTQP